MKKTTSFLLIGIMMWFLTTSCMQQPVQLDTSPDTSMDMAGPIIIISAVAIAALTASILLARKKPIALTPAGKNVKLLMHAEAPEHAEYIGDIQTKSLNDMLSVKNDLRNKAARLGGNLLVIDIIQSEFFQGKTWGYIGCGRVYYLK